VVVEIIEYTCINTPFVSKVRISIVADKLRGLSVYVPWSYIEMINTDDKWDELSIRVGGIVLILRDPSGGVGNVLLDEVHEYLKTHICEEERYGESH